MRAMRFVGLVFIFLPMLWAKLPRRETVLKKRQSCSSKMTGSDGVSSRDVSKLDTIIANDWTGR